MSPDDDTQGALPSKTFPVDFEPQTLQKDSSHPKDCPQLISDPTRQQVPPIEGTANSLPMGQGRPIRPPAGASPGETLLGDSSAEKSLPPSINPPGHLNPSETIEDENLPRVLLTKDNAKDCSLAEGASGLPMNPPAPKILNPRIDQSNNNRGRSVERVPGGLRRSGSFPSIDLQFGLGADVNFQVRLEGDPSPTRKRAPWDFGKLPPRFSQRSSQQQLQWLQLIYDCCRKFSQLLCFTSVSD